MTEKTTQSVANLGYHAHIYYDATKTRGNAERVCAALSEKFKVESKSSATRRADRTRSAMRWSSLSPKSSRMSCRI